MASTLDGAEQVLFFGRGAVCSAGYAKEGPRTMEEEGAVLGRQA
jgi:hypothetical protein